MKKAIETMTEQFSTFAEMQKTMFDGMFGENPFKIENPYLNFKNPTEIYENTVKFHTACIQYHNSVLSMLEAMNSLNPIKTNK